MHSAKTLACAFAAPEMNTDAGRTATFGSRSSMLADVKIDKTTTTLKVVVGWEGMLSIAKKGSGNEAV